MKEKREKSSLSFVKAAWRRQADSAPQLSEEWLKKAMPAVVARSAERYEAPVQFFVGMVLSAAVSVLVFVLSNMLWQADSKDQRVLVYMLNRSYLSSLVSEQ